MGEKRKRSKISRTKFIVIFGIITLVILTVFGYFVFREIEFRKPIEESWGQAYYVHLKDIDKKEDAKDKIPDQAKNVKASFYEIKKVEKPVLVIKYEIEQKNYTNVYYIEDDDEVNSLVYQQPTTFELLFNIEKDDYDYYITVVDDDKEYYQSVSDQIVQDKGDSEEVDQTADYSFSKDAKDSVTLADGTDLTLSQFDRTFVRPKVEEEYVDLNLHFNERTLKKLIKKLINDYKDQDALLTDDVKKEVAVQKEDVLRKEKQIADRQKELKEKEIESVLKKLIGYWHATNTENFNEFYQVTLDGKTWMFEEGLMATELFYYDSMKNIDLQDDVLSFDFIGKKIKIDVSNIDQKKITINGKIKCSYAGKDVETAQRIILNLQY